MEDQCGWEWFDGEVLGHRDAWSLVQVVGEVNIGTEEEPEPEAR